MNVIEFGIGETGTGNVIVLTDVIAPEVTVIVVVLIGEKVMVAQVGRSVSNF